MIKKLRRVDGALALNQVKHILKRIEILISGAMQINYLFI